MAVPRSTTDSAVRIPFGTKVLEGDLHVPTDVRGIVLFAHGSGSSRHSPRNQYVASSLQDAGLATFLMDLLTRDEEDVDQYTAHLRFDINLLAVRLTAATDWLESRADVAGLSVGYFGASTGAGAALVAAAERPARVKAVVSRGGRPDLAADALERVEAPTLLIVGGRDRSVVGLNEQAMRRLHVTTALEIVPGATHLFEERGALEEVARLARAWFEQYL